MVELLRVARRRWRVLVAFAALGVASASVLTIQMEPSYRATAQVYVTAANSVTDEDGSSLSDAGYFTANRVPSYPGLVASARVLQPVIEELDLNTTPEELADQVAAQSPPNTVLVEVYADSSAAERSAEIANAVARNLVGVVEELDRPKGAGAPVVRLTVTREATPPADPRSPVPAINVSAGLLAGLALGLGGAMLRESLDATVRDADEVESRTGLVTLTEVPWDPDVDPTLVVGQAGAADPDWPEGWSDAYRRLRVALDHESAVDRPRTLLVTGASPGEGSTTTAVNLAAALAQGSRRTVLVDADLRRPDLGERLGLASDLGVSSALAGHASPDELRQRALGVDVVVGGPVPPNPSELLGSRAFGDLVERLRAEYDTVVIDAAPLLGVTDAAVAARVADAVVVVCRPRHTRRRDLDDALAALRAVGARVAGVVVNGVRRSTPAGDWSRGVLAGRKRS